MADDHNDHITAREFDGFKDAVVDAMSSGFKGVHDRLDVTNGRLGKHDNEIRALLERAAAQGVKLDEIEKREREHKRRTDPSGVVHSHTRADDTDAITKKDLKNALFVAGAVLGFIGGVIKYGPVVLKAIAP